MKSLKIGLSIIIAIWFIISAFYIPHIVNNKLQNATNKRTFRIDYDARRDSLRKIISETTNIPDTLIYADLHGYFSTKYYENFCITLTVDIYFHSDDQFNFNNIDQIDSAVSKFISRNFISSNKYDIEYLIRTYPKKDDYYDRHVWLFKHD